MIYLILFLYIYLYTFMVRPKREKNIDFLILYLPISILLIIILGLQYEVGTDYSSYYAIGEGTKSVGWIAGRSEYLFIWIVELVKNVGNPQMLFVIIGTIQVMFLILIANEINKLGFKMHDFFFLYFTLSVNFFSQFNGIRQYTAIYIVVYGIMKLITNHNLSYIILVGIASLFHRSAIFYLPIIFFKKISRKKVSLKIITIIIFGLMVIVSLDITKYIEILLSYTTYKSYIGSNFATRLSFQGIVTKIPKILIVLFSSYIIKDKGLKDKEIELINFGYLGLIVLVISFASSLIWRFYQYIDIFIIFPVLILFNDEKYRTYKVLISLALFIMLIIKIIVIPRGEFIYRSILFK